MENQRSLGLVTTTSIVIGNMVGSGVFLLPASLAIYGTYSLWGWGFSSVGALLLAWVFSSLSRRLPKAGGPYAYPREAFGDLTGFSIAWVYWLSILGTNAAIAVAFASYLAVFVPALASTPLYGALAALAALWVLTAVNVWGVRAAGNVQLITVILKLTPLLALAVFGVFHFDPKVLASGHTTSAPAAAINACATLTMWAFLGLECATVPAEHVRDPQKTIPRATLLGTIIAAAFYVVCTTVVMGIIPSDTLAHSNAPFADAAQLLWGSWAGEIIAAAAMISCFGALNGWILMQGQFPQAVANDGLFPKLFARESRHRTPTLGLVLSSILASVLIFMNYSHGLVAMFTTIILIATFWVLVAYLLCAAAEIVLSRPDKLSRWQRFRNTTLAGATAVFALWAIYGAGLEWVFWGSVSLLLGVPLYYWHQRHAQTASDNA